MARIYGQVIRNRIEQETKDLEEQAGFREGLLCVDHIFTLRQIIERRKARRTHLTFVDLRKVCDMVPIKN